MARSFPTMSMTHHTVEVRPDIPDAVVLGMLLEEYELHADGRAIPLGEKRIEILLKPSQAREIAAHLSVAFNALSKEEK